MPRKQKAAEVEAATIEPEFEPEFEPRFTLMASQPGAVRALMAALPLLGVEERVAERIVREFELWASR